MSSYLLLRNNKESGPFTLEEIQGMTLKSYDLIWVVGKSAAWRYPGEIQDLKPFAPPVPEQLTDLFARKSSGKKSDTPGFSTQESAPAKISESIITRAREQNGQKISSGRSVYVNLPVDKKPAAKHHDRIQFEMEAPEVLRREPVYDYYDLYKKRPSGISHISGKLLWVSILTLLFGTGILTGYFISDRRNFFSTAEKPTHKQGPGTFPNQVNSKNIPDKNILPEKDLTTMRSADSVKMINSDHKRQSTVQKKKFNKSGSEKKDSSQNIPVSTSPSPIIDHLTESSLPKTDILFQLIKAHPENYISIQPGRFSTGVFGGISSFPIALTNNSQVFLPLVVVSIEYIQNNEKVFKTENLSYNNLEPGETVTLKAPKSARGVRISTHMVVLNAAQAGSETSN